MKQKQLYWIRASTFLLLIPLLLLVACRPPIPVPQTPTPVPPTATRTPTPRPTAAAPLATPTPLPPPTPLPTPTPQPLVRLPGAYVDVLQTTLLSAPRGETLRTLVAGDRLGVIGITPDGNWLQVRYQPDLSNPPIDGWVRRADVTLFTEPSGLQTTEHVTSTPQPLATPLPEQNSRGQTATVIADRLHLRAGPGVDQSILSTLPYGNILQAIGRTEDSSWIQVETESGLEGWVAARWLSVVADVNDLPITGVATTGVPLSIAPPSLSGTIVFQNRNDGDIFIITASGSNIQRLTYGFDPAFSPDGSLIAFTRWDEPRGLWLTKRDGSNPHLLISANQPRSPTWTPDGRAIIFERSTGDYQCYDTPMGCLSQSDFDAFFGENDCVTGPFGSFCRSDFRLIHRSSKGLTRYNLTDGSTRDLPASPEAQAPVHHPQTDQVLYLDGDALAITRDVGDDPPYHLLDQVIIGPAVYSPDGQFIYLSQRSGDHWDIWRYRSDGSQPFALTTQPPLRSRPINNVSPTISPDGRTILFLSDRQGRWQFWLMNSDGSNQRPWTRGPLAQIDLEFNYANERMADWS